MKQHVCVFEDNQFPKLYPLSLTRPVFDLRCGMLTLREKWSREFTENPLSLFCRSYLKDYIQQESPNISVNKTDAESCLFVNGRVLADSKLARLLSASRETVFFHKGEVVAAFLHGKNITRFVDLLKNGGDLQQFDGCARTDVENVKIIRFPWDLVHHNPEEITRDFDHFNRGGAHEGNISPHAVLVNDRNIYIGKDANIKPGAILDAGEGPIFIDDNATIMHNAVIEGPAYVGKKSTVKIGAKIYEGTSIGEVCKIGGEVEESIIHSYSNKQHDGFLGHAYLGQWVNLGADTNNSDLKNNYGNVKVHIDGELIDSGSMFVGLFMGDHSKTGINTMFNTGTVVGTMCNVFGAGFPPKYIPSFSWGGSDGLVEYDLEKAISTARTVMGRRKKEMTPEYENIFRHLFAEIGNSLNDS